MVQWLCLLHEVVIRLEFSLIIPCCNAVSRWWTDMTDRAYVLSRCLIFGRNSTSNRHWQQHSDMTECVGLMEISGPQWDITNSRVLRSAVRSQSLFRPNAAHKMSLMGLTKFLWRYLVRGVNQWTRLGVKIVDKPLSKRRDVDQGLKHTTRNANGFGETSTIVLYWSFYSTGRDDLLHVCLIVVQSV